MHGVPCFWTMCPLCRLASGLSDSAVTWSLRERLGCLDRDCTIEPQLRSRYPRGAGSGNETLNICIAVCMLGGIVLAIPGLQITSYPGRLARISAHSGDWNLSMWIADDNNSSALRHACVMPGAVSRTH